MIFKNFLKRSIGRVQVLESKTKNDAGYKYKQQERCCSFCDLNFYHCSWMLCSGWVTQRQFSSLKMTINPISALNSSKMVYISNLSNKATQENIEILFSASEVQKVEIAQNNIDGKQHARVSFKTHQGFFRVHFKMPWMPWV